jgi:hypothetical protein
MWLQHAAAVHFFTEVLNVPIVACLCLAALAAARVLVKETAIRWAKARPCAAAVGLAAD